MQYHAKPCNTMQYHASLITADGAYHCPVGSIMAIFITMFYTDVKLCPEGQLGPPVSDEKVWLKIITFSSCLQEIEMCYMCSTLDVWWCSFVKGFGSCLGNSIFLTEESAFFMLPRFSAIVFFHFPNIKKHSTFIFHILISFSTGCCLMTAPTGPKGKSM